jgi:hypothetical protein
MGSMKRGVLAAMRMGVKTAAMQLGPRGGRSSINANGRERTSSAHAAIVEPPSINVAPKEPGPPDE